MNALIGKVIVEIGRTLGKAVIAGIGMELAKVAGTHLQKRLAAKPAPKDAKAAKAGEPAESAEDRRKDKESGADPDVDRVKAENERLRAEVERLREELAAARD